MSEMTHFEQYCASLNSLCESMQAGHEPSSEDEAYRALEYAKSMQLEQSGDVLLFCAAVNLMNAFVKQPDCRSFGYTFKAEVPRLIERLQKSPIEGVRFDCSMDGRNSLTVVEICGLQFSFHCVRVSGLRHHDSRIPFDGIRKQRCASTLFRLAETNRLMRSL